MDPLSTLNLVPGNTLTDAKRHYRLLSIKYHPDKNPNNPIATEMFRRIVDSYELIKSNPQLLDSTKKSSKPDGFFGYIVAHASVSVYSVYFQEIRTIRITRKRICDACEGTGSTLGIGSICTLCKGKKKVRNKVSQLIGIKDECPACSGTGAVSAPECAVCAGKGFYEETIPINFKVSLNQFVRKGILIRNMGNEYKKGNFGDIQLVLEQDLSSHIVCDDNKFRMTYYITPVQSIVGDTVDIEIFGKKFKVKIEPDKDVEFLKDTRSDGITRDIQIDFIVKKPVITAESAALYQKILEIEKLKI